MPRGGKSWFLLGVNGRDVIGVASWQGLDNDGLSRYVATTPHCKKLGLGQSLTDLAQVKAIVEEHYGVQDAVPDLREIGLVEVYRVRCGDCRSYLQDGNEWLDRLEALRAARDAGWLTRPDLNSVATERLVRCTSCRAADVPVAVG